VFPNMRILLYEPCKETGVALPAENAIDDNKYDEEVQSGSEFTSGYTIDLEDIKNPYFRVYTQREYPDDGRKSMMVKYNSPKDYLSSIVAKYNIDFDFSKEGYPPVESKDEKENTDADTNDISKWRPYIEGVLRKKDPLAENRNLLQKLTTSEYKHRFMRLYPDALIWFELPSYLMRKGLFVNPRAKPLGILPLATVGSIRAPGLAELMAYAEDPLETDEEIPEIDDSALDTLEIEIGRNQGVINLRCEDWRQRCKWLECIQIAMFEGKKYAGMDEFTNDSFKVKEQSELELLQVQEQPELSRQDSRHLYILLGDSLWARKANTIRAEKCVSSPTI